ncbi:phenylalanine--tRNA ligase subunit beta [Pseudenhygromyxa sp. WMMC2535]|uniref:phenylalanine--tRNA ligase subunit beta n=1 Tax=Pseudenhygromyxa sp. WMMC2535 TaxID=2712867 RepID=UPI0015580564|nr:phenylalanine--tRNA ligase subunit beta [Pseudenhygromyxa sp. WMMC2535]NVB41704.1 phenylalanine--tRNA ligase subunit beta [Pseudenhygromyxa sp. WMMC2535]
MLISCTWLDELLTLPGGARVDVDPSTPAGASPHAAAALADTLTGLGLEVEGLHYFDLPKVIVGEIREITPHPKADKLNVVRLFDGAADVQVVCGASNLPAIGGKVAFAPLGTTLPGGLEIGARTLRGVDSSGMICSEAELDIGGDDEGILVLPEDWAAGSLLRDCVPGIRDAVIEIAVTPNRPDALGHLGVAWDLAAKLGAELKAPAPWRAPAELPREPGLVELRAGDRCPRYFAVGLEGATVGRAPLDARVRLHRVGLRAINDVVDVTNYVLMETGQPLHAFDRDKLAGGKVVVRMAGEGEAMTTLDGTEIELGADDLVIADGERPQALAGVMGGEDSMVAAGSGALLLEVAYFAPPGIRRSAKRYGFHTDSSHRFERGVDHGEKLEMALGRALALLAAWCGATCVAWHEAVGERPEAPTIVLRPERVAGLLGLKIPEARCEEILRGLGVELVREGDAWRCTPPSFRPDLVREADLIEEIMRHHGLDAIPAVHCAGSQRAEPIPEDPQRARVEHLSGLLAARGLVEHLSLAFGAEEAMAPFTEIPAERMVRVSNPLRSQLAVMRTHMLPGLLDAAAFNHARHDRDLAIFEHGRIYSWPEGERAAGEGPTAAVDRRLPEEHRRVGILRMDRGRPADESAAARAAAEGARAVIADLLGVLEAIGLWAEPAAAAIVPWLHPGVQIGLWIGGRQVGVAGELHPDLRDAHGFDGAQLAYGELWFEALPVLGPVQFALTPRFPSSARDLSLDLADGISAHDVSRAIREAADALANEISSEHPDDPLCLGWSAESGTHHAVEAIEDYRGKGVEPGRHALLLRLHYRAGERSVTDAEVQALHDAIVTAACDRLRAQDGALRVR